MIQYRPVSVDYALGDAVSICLGSDVNPIALNVLPPIAADILSGSSGPGNVLSFFPANNTLVASQSWLENHALVLTHNGSAELTLGDGTAVVTVTLTLAKV